ncbi:MAG: BamA/TamA family outer membrane protein [Labilithrix sp.]|nr:BamA/TamA family outer membrane protein [Labilithrix sp.]
MAPLVIVRIVRFVQVRRPSFGDRLHRLHRLHPLAFTVLALLLLAPLTGCYRVPEGKSAVASVAIEGTPDVDVDDLKERIATRETSRFLGLVYGFVYDYELFDRYALRRDLTRIERAMRAKGFYQAAVHVARVVQSGNKVHVTIEVEQGKPVLIDSVTFEGDETLDPAAREELTSRVAGVLPHGARLDEDKLEEAERAALRALTAKGHAMARVERRAEVDLATDTARVLYEIDPGPLARFGPIKFEGLGELPESTVRKVFRIEEGDPYSSEDIDESRQALLDLGVFAGLDVDQDVSKCRETRIVPLTVRAEPAKLRALIIGGGSEFDSLKTDVHGTIGWQSSNFWGGLRRFEVRQKPGIIFYPTRFPDLEPPKQLLYEGRFTATLRQPAFVEARTTGVARVDYNMYPVLLPGSTTQNVLGYHEIRQSLGVERTFLRRLFVNPAYGFQANFPFDYVGTTPGVDTLLISYLDIFSALDFRDDPLNTKKGFYIGNQLQVAGGLLQGDATDFRVQPEIRGYVPVSKRMVFAARMSVGFLFPLDYGRYAEINFKNPGSSRIEGSARDYQILFFRGFYAGGPSSNRGYPLRGIGPYDLIPYLSPAGQSISASGCNPNDRACSLPTGGLSLWEASTELRIQVAGAFSTALFCDAADVSPFRLDLRFDRPHLSCGVGGRYDTPVGPIRLDIGYRIPGLQVLGDASNERRADELLGIPIALAFGIGEAF